MLISPDSQGEGSGQQLSPDKASCSQGTVRAQPPIWPGTRDCIDLLAGVEEGSLHSGRNLVGGLYSSLLFSFHSFVYPSTISRVDLGDLELG